MPKLIGPISHDRWEKEVRRQLASQLPPDWIVICNVAWALKNDAGYVRDGQCDFVVLAPLLGMAIVEVKGSQSVRVGDDGIWYRREINRRTGRVSQEIAIDEPPPEQANRNMHNLAKIVSSDLSMELFPGAYAFLVAYPNGIVQGNSALYDSSTLVTREHMDRLASSIRNALNARGAPSTGRYFTNDIAARAAATLSNSRFIVRGGDTPLDIHDDVIDIDELTRQQFAALRGAFDLKSVAIVGPAGSGKTMLALWKLTALLEEGKRAIYICFNRSLAEYLQSKNLHAASAIVSVDRYFTQIAGNRTDVAKDTSYFKEQLPLHVLDVAVDMLSADKYDAIIVDEGQDFGESRVIALLDLLKKDGQWLFFADWDQDIYQTGSSEVFGSEVTFRLFHNCRNTELTNSATNTYCAHSVTPMPGVPIGALPVVFKCQPGNNMAARAWELIHEMCPDGGAVILSPFRIDNSCMASVRKGYGLQLTEDLNKLGDPGYVYFSTIKAFKGLEAKCVVLVHAEIPGQSLGLAPEDLYVACTRTTGRLAILTSSEEAQIWFSQVHK